MNLSWISSSRSVWGMLVCCLSGGLHEDLSRWTPGLSSVLSCVLTGFVKIFHLLRSFPQLNGNPVSGGFLPPLSFDAPSSFPFPFFSQYSLLSRICLKVKSVVCCCGLIHCSLSLTLSLCFHFLRLCQPFKMLKGLTWLLTNNMFIDRSALSLRPADSPQPLCWDEKSNRSVNRTQTLLLLPVELTNIVVQ